MTILMSIIHHFNRFRKEAHLFFVATFEQNWQNKQYYPNSKSTFLQVYIYTFFFFFGFAILGIILTIIGKFCKTAIKLLRKTKISLMKTSLKLYLLYNLVDFIYSNITLFLKISIINLLW